MRERKSKSRERKPKQKRTAVTKSDTLPTIASARTGLTGKDDAIMKNLPKNYTGKTIGNVLGYLLQKKDLEGTAISLAKSIQTEMEADDFVVVVNGKNAELGDKIADYMVKREHKLPDGQVKAYNQLEIEVSAVQEGGFYRLH